MNKLTSISLHLARVMGKPNPVAHDYPDFVSCQTNPEAIKADERGSYGWNPHANLSQWAECVLWAAMNGICPMIDSVACWAAKDHQDTIIWVCENTQSSIQSSIQAATLEAIALATGWEESK